AHAIGEYHPSGVRGKFPTVLGRILLKGGVFLHGVVAAVHEFVVGWPAAKRQMEGPREGANPTCYLIAAGLFQKIAGAREARAKSLKCFRSQPDAAFRGVEVHKETKNSRAVGRPGGKRVKMQEIVAGVEARGAAFFLNGTITGVIELPFSRIGRKETG